jgi:hypothetical protein
MAAKDITAKEKAQAGLWMIQQAILQLIRNKGPMQPYQVSDELGIRWQSPEGDDSASIGHQIMLSMAATGQLVTDPGSHPRYSLST